MNRKDRRAKEKKMKAMKAPSATGRAEHSPKPASHSSSSGHIDKKQIEQTIKKHIDLNAASKQDLGSGRVKYSIPMPKELVHEHVTRISSKLTDQNGLINKDEYIKYFHQSQHLIAQEKYGPAAEILTELLKVRPTDTGVLKLLGLVSEKIKNYGAAINFFQEVLKHKSDEYEVEAGIGALYSRIDRLEESNNILLALVKNKTKFSKLQTQARAEIHGSLANNYMLMGDKKKAIEHQNTACSIQPDNPSLLYNLATQMRAIEDPDSVHFKSLKKLEKSSKLEKDLSAQTLINFALFDCYDKFKEYETAFEYALKGSNIKKSIIKTRPPQEIDLGFKEIRDYFDESFFEKTDIKGYDSELPVFVLGMPRSGTTLLEQIVLSHSQVEGVGEDALIGHLLRNFSHLPKHNKNFYPLRHANNTQYLTPELIGENYCNYLQDKYPNASRIINKAIGNFIFIGFLSLALPKARFIHIKRNAMDCCLSSFSKNFIDESQSFSYDLEELGTYYRNYVEIMDHWNNVLPGRILNVSYEGIVDDLEGNAHKIIDFLGLPWDEKCLRFYETKNTVRTASVAQVRRPIYKSAVGRWKRYGPKVIPLIEALGHAAPPEAINYLKDIKTTN